MEDVSEYGVGYDLLSQTPNGVKPFEERFIKVKGREGGQSITMTAHQIAEARREREKYYLYVIIFLDHKALLYINPNPADALANVLGED